MGNVKAKTRSHRLAAQPRAAARLTRQGRILHGDFCHSARAADAKPMAERYTSRAPELNRGRHLTPHGLRARWLHAGWTAPSNKDQLQSGIRRMPRPPPVRYRLSLVVESLDQRHSRGHARKRRCETSGEMRLAQEAPRRQRWDPHYPGRRKRPQAELRFQALDWNLRGAR